MVEVLRILSMKEIDTHFSAIRDYITGLQESNNRLRKILEEYNLNDEIQKKNDEISALHHNALMVMTDLEHERQQEFIQKHYKSCKNAGRFQYELCGTGIGTGITIKCPVCGASDDITDYAAW